MTEEGAAAPRTAVARSVSGDLRQWTHPDPGARGSGYTLVELLLVVALVGVLSAIAVVVYRGYVLKANNATAEHQITAMSAIITNYWNDNRAYPGTLSDAGLDGSKDPWGRQYVYYNIDADGKGGARKDHALNPINTDFDLYSDGPDGVSKAQITQTDSLDDVIRANNGAFVGVAADF